MTPVPLDGQPPPHRRPLRAAPMGRPLREPSDVERAAFLARVKASTLELNLARIAAEDLCRAHDQAALYIRLGVPVPDMLEDLIATMTERWERYRWHLPGLSPEKGYRR
jgi:hypothetical protein